MAGPVLNTANCAPGSAVSLKWSRYTSQVIAAPITAPINCAPMYNPTSSQGNFSAMANPIVTAGFKCAPLYGPAITTPVNTASAQPVVITIQPELNPLVPFNTTFATTPVPNKIKNIVPISSAANGVITI